MRQPQHRNRARARSRRQPNPANKVYESNGPDVKVRGTPQQIADKYMQLGRDALSSGDAVKAENYFQHAEHYLRIIAAAQEQMQQRRAQQEQRRQEAAARRKGNGSGVQQDGAQPEADAGDGREDGKSAEVVVLPTEGVVSETDDALGAGGNGGGEAAAEVQPAWDGPAPDFLTTPVNVDAAASESPQAEDEGARQESGEEEQSATLRARPARRRRTPRSRKGDGAADSAAEE